ncbi:hypothetical protein NEF87_003818 [Candidatus Lokiarchaeum ossiferum]|uniref:Ribbon-helix-helix protein, CopG family n=1 Tax=Candidatus Lokiarchaeum ossiferum TaxID=2951803 RepID=A0ABY6HVI3_9ARCH|nr:hypothetical protein NEF87_003818 [Candidatus Lokiarchaeum sp. B-35]
MSQINFRIDPEDMEIIREVAKSKGMSLSEIAKRSLLKEIQAKRIELAFQRLKEGEIGFKKAWKLSGLSYEKFLLEWAQRDAIEIIPDNLLAREENFALNFDLSKLLKHRD